MRTEPNWKKRLKRHKELTDCCRNNHDPTLCGLIRPSRDCSHHKEVTADDPFVVDWEASLR